MATARYITPPPQPLPPPCVILELSQEEAATLMQLTLMVSGDYDKSRRAHTNSIQEALHKLNIDHIRKELVEIEQDQSDISEWIDVVILGLDGASRAGYTPEQIAAALLNKQIRNESRTWPDWRTAPMDKAIEHVRS